MVVKQGPVVLPVARHPGPRPWRHSVHLPAFLLVSRLPSCLPTEPVGKVIQNFIFPGGDNLAFIYFNGRNVLFYCLAFGGRPGLRLLGHSQHLPGRALCLPAMNNSEAIKGEMLVWGFLPRIARPESGAHGRGCH